MLIVDVLGDRVNDVATFQDVPLPVIVTTLDPSVKVLVDVPELVKDGTVKL